MEAHSAWVEFISKWVTTDKHNFMTFTESVQQTLKMGAQMGCAELGGKEDNCDMAMQCDPGLDGPYSGPAAQLIWNSLITIHKMYHEYHRALISVTGEFGLNVNKMQNTFAPIPVPKTNDWLNILIDLLTMGTLTGLAPFFNGFVKKMPSFCNPSSFDNAKEISTNLADQITTLAKDLLEAPKPGEWTPEEQDNLSAYMGQIIKGWKNSTGVGLKNLFDGSPQSISVLGNVI